MGLKLDDAYTAQLQVILRIAHGLSEAATFPSHPPAVIDSIRLPSPCLLFPSRQALVMKSFLQHPLRAEELNTSKSQSLRHGAT